MLPNIYSVSHRRFKSPRDREKETFRWEAEQGEIHVAALNAHFALGQ